jgi:hypothetical protein
MPATINGTSGFGGNLTGNVTGNADTATAANSATALSGPAFRAYATGTTTAASGTSTKVTLAAEDFDTASCFASSRFTPNVAGYYLINAAIRAEAIAAATAEIWKNGSAYARGSHGSGGGYVSNVSDVVFLNGTTDYVELYVYHGGTGSATIGNFGQQSTFLSGFLVRQA